jgi:hypothetical protein
MSQINLKYLVAGVIATFLVLVCYAVIVNADDVTTSVTVGNSAPGFTVAVAESPASDSTTPTNDGSNVTFTATATDSNNENYYLAICKTDAITAVNDAAPTCDGGNWCVSTSTTSGSQANCAYTAQSGDAESNAWFAFVCDGNTSAASCSSSTQGSGSSGSPFKVNHRPTFAAISNDTPQNPGADITWSTSVGTTDTDTDTVADTVRLIVCKTTGLTAGDCDGGASDRWCQSSAVANNPSCAYSIPTPTADTSYSAFVYLVDNHNFAATGGNQGSDEAYVVNNVAPVVSSVTVNGGADISLTEGTTTSVVVGATVTDNNACGDISTVESSLYRSGITYGGCDINAEDDSNDCYAQVTCTIVGGGNTCDGATDASADYTCTVDVQYHADPTDAATIYTAEEWLATVNAIDNNAATDNTEVSAGVELLSLVGYDVTSSIAYGSLSVGQSNDPLDKITTVTATGNVGLDMEVSGTDMDDGGVNTIAVAQQRYALAASTAYASGSQLSGTDTEIELNCSKTTITGSPETAGTWWGLEIPGGTVAGTYSGSNTLVAVKGETVNW